MDDLMDLHYNLARNGLSQRNTGLQNQVAVQSLTHRNQIREMASMMLITSEMYLFQLDKEGRQLLRLGEREPAGLYPRLL